jgi:hypothetical protein
MKRTSQVIGLSLCLALAGFSGAASAKGCLKGAAAGGIAGHFAHHHGLIGAAAGCAIGHAHAKHKEAQVAQNSR